MTRFRIWIYRLTAAFIGGGASAASAAVGAIAIDPGHFNMAEGIWHTLHLAGATFCVSGFVSILLYLKQHPLPEWDGLERRGTNGNGATT